MKCFRQIFFAFFAFAISFTSLTSCGIRYPATNSMPISHDLWDKDLKKHISSTGLVDYKGWLKDTSDLHKYLNLLEKNHPNKKNWSRDEQLAYWINAYNAYTVVLILRNYPLKSIKDIKNGIPFVNTVWDIKFISIEGKKYDLNNLEHGIIRPRFKDPRIHFAVNCASISCPPLRNEAYVAARIDEQLDEQAKQFINANPSNTITTSSATLSSIFKWFSGDFKNAGGVRTFVNTYSKTPIAKSTKVDYADYDWNLNEVK